MKIEKFGFEHSDEDIEAKKIEEKINENNRQYAQIRGEKIEKIKEGTEKIKVVPTKGEPFETEAYVIRQEVDGKPQLFVGVNKLHAKQLEYWGESAQVANRDIGVNDRYEIGPDGKITVYAVHAEQWKPSVAQKTKNEIAAARDKIKEKIFKKSDESNQQKDNADSSEVEKQS